MFRNTISLLKENTCHILLISPQKDCIIMENIILSIIEKGGHYFEKVIKKCIFL